jgi:hypothetical protein
MLKKTTQWRGARGVRALRRFAEIEVSIAALGDDDLLDFADIFVGNPQTPLAEIASAEMRKRNIGL